MRVLLLTDSLGLARLKPQVVEHKDCWPELVKNALTEVSFHQVSIGGATSSDLLRQVAYHMPFSPDVIILQVGIVDCVPRVFSKYMLSTLRLLGPVGNSIIAALHHTKLKFIRRTQYVSPQKFRSNLRRMGAVCKNSTIWSLSIVGASPEYDLILPRVSSRIKNYNEILADESHVFVDCRSLESYGLMTDMHHLNKKGHQALANMLIARLTTAFSDHLS